MHAKSQKLLHHQVSLHSCHSKDLRGGWTWSTHWNNDCINIFLSFNQRVSIVNWTKETGETNGFTSTSVKSSLKPSVSWSNANKHMQNNPKTYHNSARVPTLPVHTEFQYISACFHICKIKRKECVERRLLFLPVSTKLDASLKQIHANSPSRPAPRSSSIQCYRPSGPCISLKQCRLVYANSLSKV